MPAGFTPVRTFRFGRLVLLAATVAFAAAIGALAGSLATGGFGANANREAAAEAPLKPALDRMEQQLAALRSSVESSTQDMHTRTLRIAERLDRSERAQTEPTQKLAKISDALDRLERRSSQAAQTASASPEVTGAIGAPAADAKKTTPPIVSGWALYQVRHGMALIEGREGLIQVEPGDMLPGLGRVETIRKQDGRWVVVTSRGLIVER
jgi:TolA-binding protein